MKKIITLSLIIAMSVMLGLGINNIVEGGSNKKTFTFIEENGFIVVDDGDANDSVQTVVCEVVSEEEVGFELISPSDYVCVNIFDSEDILVLENEEFMVGTKVLVTFFHDDVKSVEMLRFEN